MWFWLALISAVLGAVDVILNKKILHKVSPSVLSWSLYILTLPILTVLVIMEGKPNINFIFWVAVIASAITFVIGKNIINDSLKNNLVSHIIPLTAFSGVFTYLFGLVLLSESIKPLPLLGLLLVVVGSYVLNVKAAKEGILEPFKILFLNKKSFFFLIALVLTSLTAIFDKMAVVNTEPVGPMFTLFLEQIIMSILLTFYLIAKEGKTWIPEIRQNFGMLLINSLVYLGIAFFVYTAYASNGPVALVIGIKRVQIFFILLLGYIYLKDKPSKAAWISSLIMIAGVLLIKIG